MCIFRIGYGKKYRYGFEKQITGSDMFYRLESKKRVGAIHTIGILLIKAYYLLNMAC